MNKLFSTSGKKTSAKRSVIIVSGLPRSGTSMMMKILAEGGVPIITDEIRRADPDNPNGYFEYETVRQLSSGNVDWLEKAAGKAVKVISALLEHLPPNHFYKIIFLERDLQEVMVSQRKMLDHRNEQPKGDDIEIEAQMRKHLSVMKPWLVRQPNMEVLYINYNELIKDPEPFCDKIINFLELPLNKTRMLAVPNKQLYRNRATSEK